MVLFTYFSWNLSHISRQVTSILSNKYNLEQINSHIPHPIHYPKQQKNTPYTMHTAHSTLAHNTTQSPYINHLTNGIRPLRRLLNLMNSI